MQRGGDRGKPVNPYNKTEVGVFTDRKGGCGVEGGGWEGGGGGWWCVVGGGGRRLRKEDGD